MQDPHDVDLDPQKISAFWAWLASHQSALNTLESPDDPFWDELLAHLQGVNEGLWFEVSAPGDEDRELVMEILKFGVDVEVLQPPGLRKRIAEALNAAAKRYDKSGTEP